MQHIITRLSSRPLSISLFMAMEAHVKSEQFIAGTDVGSGRVGSLEDGGAVLVGLLALVAHQRENGSQAGI